jgi:hypothetical protein
MAYLSSFRSSKGMRRRVGAYPLDGALVAGADPHESASSITLFFPYQCRPRARTLLAIVEASCEN